jgi:hypothetical protein
VSVEPEVLPEDEVVVVVTVSASFLQASTNTDDDTAPITRLFKKFFLSIVCSPFKFNLNR